MNDRSPPPEEPNAFVLFVLLLALPGLPLLYGWAFASLWTAALVPFGVPALAWEHGVALVALAQTVKLILGITRKDDRPASKVLVEVVLTAIVVCMLVGLVALVTP